MAKTLAGFIGIPVAIVELLCFIKVILCCVINMLCYFIELIGLNLVGRSLRQVKFYVENRRVRFDLLENLD